MPAYNYNQAQQLFRDLINQCTDLDQNSIIPNLEIAGPQEIAFINENNMYLSLHPNQESPSLATTQCKRELLQLLPPCGLKARFGDAVYYFSLPYYIRHKSRTIQQILAGETPRPAFVAYVRRFDPTLNTEVVYVRSIYRSNSEGPSWRVATDRLPEEPKTWIGKPRKSYHLQDNPSGEYTADYPIELDPLLNTIFAELKEYRDAPTMLEAGPYFYHILSPSHKLEINGNNVHIESETFWFEKLKILKNDRRATLGEFRDPNDPASFEFNDPASAPDFDKGLVLNYPAETPLYGKINSFIFISRNREILYTLNIARTSANSQGYVSWIGKIQPTNYGGVHRYGVKRKDIYVPEKLLFPGAEYHYTDSQGNLVSLFPKIRGRYPHAGDRIYTAGMDPCYCDASRWTHKLPPLRGFLEFIAQTQQGRRITKERHVTQELYRMRKSPALLDLPEITLTKPLDDALSASPVSMLHTLESYREQPELFSQGVRELFNDEVLKEEYQSQIVDFARSKPDVFMQIITDGLKSLQDPRHRFVLTEDVFLYSVLYAALQKRFAFPAAPGPKPHFFREHDLWRARHRITVEIGNREFINRVLLPPQTQNYILYVLETVTAFLENVAITQIDPQPLTINFVPVTAGDMYQRQLVWYDYSNQTLYISLTGKFRTRAQTVSAVTHGIASWLWHDILSRTQPAYKYQGRELTESGMMNEIISFLAGMFADYIVYGPHRLAHSLGYQLDRLPKQWLKRFAIFEQYIQKSNGQQTTIGYPDKGAVDFSV